MKESNIEPEKFAYVAAHDLQEPLNTLSGLINLLHYHTGASMDGEIKNLLEYSRIGSAKTNITSFSMEGAVKVDITIKQSYI